MLECGKNMKGTMKEECTVCNVIDDEQHRLVSCEKWSDLGTDNKTQFQDIYSENVEVINRVLIQIENLWDTRFKNGRMKK